MVGYEAMAVVVSRICIGVLVSALIAVFRASGVGNEIDSLNFLFGYQNGWTSALQSRSASTTGLVVVWYELLGERRWDYADTATCWKQKMKYIMSLVVRLGYSSTVV
eukprot:TRINITY_DN1399_c0_g3_i1.p1 TRINITY_DN1399_c0_g3~~TRINITY_DN1399_c0_g3_i1.p1  ORF type:complete len:107 (-),score=8.23 TRINITY_DN1399_c0_g3_i1:19-339(-)